MNIQNNKQKGNLNYKGFIFLFFSFFIICLLGVYLNAQNIYFTSMPTLNPDASKIVFCYEGDLWECNISGGRAYRITDMKGEERNPHISPDGQWLAFSNRHDGNSNVYIMPIKGGLIKQLTFNDAADRVDSWSWDSEYIYFTSDRLNDFTAFKIHRNGGTPKRILPHYFNTLHSVVEHPISNELFFSDTKEGEIHTHRKGYKGEYNPNLKSFNPITKNFKIHTQYNGKDLWHSIDKNGNIYFASDRVNNQYNLFQLKNGEIKQITKFETSVIKPQVSANGKMIIFEKDYQIYTYNTQDKKVKRVNLQLSYKDNLTIEQHFNINENITFFDVSPDGQKFVFISRGEMFISDIYGNYIKKIETNDERVCEARWLSDSQSVIFTQTVKGWRNLFTLQTNSNKKATQLTFDKVNNRYLSLNKERTKMVYLSGIKHLKIMDLKTFQSKTIVRDEFWAHSNTQTRFSPDSQYIAFAAHRNFEDDIFIHHLETGKTINLTNSGVSESEPFWSPDGKYLYFYADRQKPSFPLGTENSKIYRFPFHKFSKPFKSTIYEKMFLNSPKESTPPKNSINEPLISINPDQWYRNWEQITFQKGNQGMPYVINNNNETTVLYLSNHENQYVYQLWKTTLKPFSQNNTVKINGAETYDPLISSANGNYYGLVYGKIGQLDLNSNAFIPIEMNYSFSRNLRSEFNQIFFEVWASIQESFYDENFHGTDWAKIKERYQTFLPHLQSRAHLRTLINDMIGELNASHMGFGSRGKEEEKTLSMVSVQTGILFQEENPFLIKRIVEDSPADNRDIKIKMNDELVAVDNKPIDPQNNREYYFLKPTMPEELVLTFKRKVAEKYQKFSIKIHPISTYALKQKLYNEWIYENQRYVDKISQKRIAYIHMKNLQADELNNFYIEMTTEWYRREGLILDLRYNTGGNVHHKLLSFLSQKPYAQWKYRDGKFAPQPNFSPSAKPIVLLVNEQSISDAELTTTSFKELKLGKVVGTETYRNLIYSVFKNLVDGSSYMTPSWGCYTLSGLNIERHGVKPDIYVKETIKDRLEKKHPQLETAIKEILKKL